MPNFCKQMVVDDKTYAIEVLDQGGLEEYRAMLEQCIKTSDGFLLVYDVTSRRSFEAVDKFYKSIHRFKAGKPLYEMGTLRTSCSILVANKVDTMACSGHRRQVSSEEGQALAVILGTEYIETSALTGLNVENAFVTIVKNIRGVYHQNANEVDL
jgi:GTPase KRas protein